MRTLVTNAYVLDMVGEVPNIEKKDILIENNIIKKIEKDIDKEIEINKELNLESVIDILKKKELLSINFSLFSWYVYKICRANRIYCSAY